MTSVDTSNLPKFLTASLNINIPVDKPIIANPVFMVLLLSIEENKFANTYNNIDTLDNPFTKEDMSISPSFFIGFTSICIDNANNNKLVVLFIILFVFLDISSAIFTNIKLNAPIPPMPFTKLAISNFANFAQAELSISIAIDKVIIPIADLFNPPKSNAVIAFKDDTKSANSDFITNVAANNLSGSIVLKVTNDNVKIPIAIANFIRVLAFKSF